MTMAKKVYNSQPLTQEQKDRAIAYLQISVPSFADAVLLAKHAHWNVRGPVFMQLHKLFDKIYNELSDALDTLAERIQQLGGYTNGLAWEIKDKTILSNFFSPEMVEEEVRDEYPLLYGMSRALSELSAHCYAAEAASLDFVTQDIYIETGRTIDKFLWFLEAHIPDGVPGSEGSITNDEAEDIEEGFVRDGEKTEESDAGGLPGGTSSPGA